MQAFSHFIAKTARVGCVWEDFQLQTIETNLTWLKQERILRAFWNPWDTWKTRYQEDTTAPYPGFIS